MLTAVMATRRKITRFAPWLLAAVLLTVQALTFAHELQHDLHQHDDPSCVLHLHLKQTGHPPAAIALLPSSASHDMAPAAACTEAAAAPVLGYRTRAPPLTSVCSI